MDRGKQDREDSSSIFFCKSWLKGIAGKAESFLNDLDQSAAQAWQSSAQTTVSNSSLFSHDQHDQNGYFGTPTSMKGYPPVHWNETSSLDLPQAAPSILHSPQISHSIASGASQTTTSSFQPTRSLPKANTLHNEKDHLDQLLLEELNKPARDVSPSLATKEVRQMRNTAPGQLAPAAMTASSSSSSLVEKIGVSDHPRNGTGQPPLDLSPIIPHEDNMTKTGSDIEATAHLQQQLKDLIIANADLQRQLDESQFALRECKMEQKSRLSEMDAEMHLLREEIEKRRHERESCASLQSAFNEYRVKVTRVLQEKETMITELQQQLLSAPAAVTEKIPAGFVSVEEFRRCEEALEQATSEVLLQKELLQRKESQFLREMEAVQERNSQLVEQLGVEQQLRNDAEEDLSRTRREVQQQQERMAKNKTQFHEHLTKKDEEIHKLREMLVTKQHQDENSQEQMEERVRSLTEAVILKQNQLEVLRVEKHTLQEQLTRKESELQSLEQQHLSLTARASRLEQHLQEHLTSVDTVLPLSRFDTSPRGGSTLGSTSSGSGASQARGPVALVRNVALRGCDSVGRWIGVYTRRYPALRLLLLLYVLALHLAVTLLLMAGLAHPSLSTSGGSGVP